MSAHWQEAQQGVLEEGGGSHTAPMLCGGVDDGDNDEEEVFAALSGGLVTVTVGPRASHLLS